MRLNIKRKFADTFRKKTVGQLITFTIAFILFALYAYTILYESGWAVVASLRPRRDLMNNPFGIPEHFGGFQHGAPAAADPLRHGQRLR